MADKIFVAGHNGMVGRAIVRQLQQEGTTEIVTRSRNALDLLSQKDVQAFFQGENIDQIYLAAAKVGGIQANNTKPADFIYENLMVQANVIHAAHQANVQKFLFLGSSCIYPSLAKQPINEESLMMGSLEPTNEPYAIAKIAGIKMCESYNRQYGRDYRSVMPTNLYGNHDNFHPENSHVVPALLRRFHEAIITNDDKIVIWGSGEPMREFLHVDDMASACVYIMNLGGGIYDKQVQPMRSHINVGTGKDCTIRRLAETIAGVTGFKGDLVFDQSKPDGTPRKLLDTVRLSTLGWEPKIHLRQGLQTTYNWFLANQDRFKGASHQV